MTNSDYETASFIAQSLIRNNRVTANTPLTAEIIAENVDIVLSMPTWKTEIDREALIKDLQTIFNTWIGKANILFDDTDHKKWLDQKRVAINWNYWKKYKLLLQEKGWADKTIEELAEITDDTLGRLENPELKGAWDRRGMMVGHIQSGKTSNYIGLICKAADAGYKVFIVLAGIHNSLRSQTQMRLDEGFLGYISPSDPAKGGPIAAIGVGKIPPIDIKRPDTITNRSEKGDFKTDVAKKFHINPGTAPLLFVVKKNQTILRNIVDWIQFASTRIDQDGRSYIPDVPLLLIDDEADYGSVDTKALIFDENGIPDEEHNPAVLNKLIRRILFSFDQSAYVGYTATPFANIFIHESAKTINEGEDLFPRSFITALPAPSNYIGPVRVFGYIHDEPGEIPELDLIRYISDNADTDQANETIGWMPPKHNKDHIPVYQKERSVPPSLRQAILEFIIVCAIRSVRKHVNAFNSMLIHVTRFTNVQRQVYDQVHTELGNIRNKIEIGEGNSATSILKELKQLWINDFDKTTRNINNPDCPPVIWADIKNRIPGVISSIKLKLINGTAADVLDYYEHRDSGLNVIAIGGDKLSRGLTLEGLSISYFLRASRMYDTLMQMGRWFGYRPGYMDLCRLHTSEDIAQCFEHITMANEELRQEFDRCAAVHSTPLEYGHRILSHSNMLVTSRVKMRHATEINLGFQNSIVETTNFHKSNHRRTANLDALSKLISQITAIKAVKLEKNPSRLRPNQNRENWGGGYCWSNVPSSSIINFLNEYKTHPDNWKVVTSLLSEYIKEQGKNGDLTKWTVLITGGTGEQYNNVPQYPISMVQRSWSPAIRKERRSILDRYVIKRLVSNRDEAIDLDESQWATALFETRKRWTADRGRSIRKTPPELPSGLTVRNIRQKTNGLMLIYVIEDPDNGQADAEVALPFVGFALSFPQNPGEKTLKYVVNNIYYRQEIGETE